MTLDRLWAGWRGEFVTGGVDRGGDGPGPDCVFDAIVASALPDTETHVISRHPSGLVVVLLNAYPYTTGHLLIMPVRHVADLEDLSGEESSALWAVVTDATRALKSAYRPEGINLGVNLGRAAGAGIPGHLHVHALPRWNGDSNFMTSIAEARVLPEPLTESDTKIRSAWPADQPRGDDLK